MIDALTQAKEPKVRGRIASCLAALGSRLEPGTAAAVAKTITDTMAQVTDDPGTIWQLASGLSSVAESMEPKAAATMCAEVAKTLTNMSAKANGLFTAYTLWRIGDARVLLAERMESDAATTAFGTGGMNLIESQFTHTAMESRPLWQSLGTALFGRDSSRVRRNSAFAVGAMGNPYALLTGLPLMQLVTQSKPLPPQMLVDLLKHPFCVRESRRLVLDALSVTYGRSFADRWEFVQFVRDNKLPLDLTTPPKRPQSGDPPAQ